ncbi:MAG: extracellular solute-binding protein [Treponema sp.]|jgi:multiple sugar transport system substrate-binding protein|nr:extracellular solute-binding protein [Treponema sp.]
MTRITKVFIAGAVLFLAAAWIFAGAGGGEQQSSTSAKPGEAYKVYFYAWTNADNMKPLLEAFNKEYAGKYEMVYQKLADARTMTINTALASGEQIDVMTQSSAFDQRTRADSGIYLGLKQFFTKEGLDYAGVFGKSIEETQNYNGDYYGIPYCNNINMVFFNKKMFDAAGVPYPDPNWTWDDFRATARRLTSGSGANKVYGAMVDVAHPDQDLNWALIAQQKLGSFFYYRPDFKSTRFDAPEMRESLQFFYDLLMVDKSSVPLDEYTALRLQDDIVAMNGLYSGRYAMWVAPVYGCLYLNKSYGEIPAGTDIGVTNLPRPVGSSGPVSVTYTSTASIPKNVKNPDASWTALKYICIDRADLFAGPKAMHPGYQFKTVEEANKFNDIIFRDHPGLDFDMAMKVMPLPRTLISKDNSRVEGQARINDLIKANMSLVFNGEMTVDAALRDLKTKGDQYIAEDLRK